MKPAPLALLAGAMLALAPARAAEAPPGVAVLLEDDADGLLRLLTGGPGHGQAEKAVVFSGKESVKITPMQRFERGVPGWDYRITEKPGPGEYRYLRFAWKADGCAGIMVQLHDEKDWNIRYTAGADVPGWGTRFVADKPPPEWAVVTCDLFKDFGERRIRGIALTAFDGRAGYFDHIYLGRTADDLDRVDATGLRGGRPKELTADGLGGLWADLAGADAARSYLAFWSLVASPKQAVPFLRGKLRGGPGADARQLERWARELDDDDFEVRERAAARLAEHVEAAEGMLRRLLAGGPSPEVRRRVEGLLGGRVGIEGGAARVESAVRALEYAATPEARRCLDELAADGEGVHVRRLAGEAKKRLDAAGRPGRGGAEKKEGPPRSGRPPVAAPTAGMTAARER